MNLSGGRHHGLFDFVFTEREGNVLISRTVSILRLGLLNWGFTWTLDWLSLRLTVLYNFLCLYSLFVFTSLTTLIYTLSLRQVKCQGFPNTLYRLISPSRSLVRSSESKSFSKFICCEIKKQNNSIILRKLRTIFLQDPDSLVPVVPLVNRVWLGHREHRGVRTNSSRKVEPSLVLWSLYPSTFYMSRVPKHRAPVTPH